MLSIRARLRPNPVSDKSEPHPANPGRQQSQAVQKARCALAHPQVAHDMRQHQRIKHCVEGIEHPAEGSGQKSAALR